MLQPTSPLRATTDIDNIVNFAIKEDADSVVSVCESPVHPYWVYKSENKLLFLFQFLFRLDPFIQKRDI